MTEKKHEPVVRFRGVGVIKPHGIERERLYVHPNAVMIWRGRFS